ncbi:MAG: FAD:protein FMN transferase [Lachnospiraceae bacterium]|nr:FAD:protein FMN transferase [Lachnospiraceae bacterium]
MDVSQPGKMRSNNRKRVPRPGIGCILSVFLLAGSLFTAGCQRASDSPSLVSRQGFYFDTSITISVASDDAEQILDDCMKLCGEKELIFSRTLENSELYQVNHRTQNTLNVSGELAEVIQTGISFYELSDGMLDITMAPVCDLWDFKSESPVLPPKDKIVEALTHVDGSAVHISGTQLSFDRDDIQIDLGALAKGYIADCLKSFLKDQGVVSAQINLGGNVLLVGSKPDGSAWKVGIQKPFADRGTVEQVLEITDQSVVSSGIYEREFELDGVQYYHILDPHTGYPVQTDLAQATIVSDSSLLGDAYSTTCVLLGHEKAKSLTDAHQDVIKNCILTERVI